MNQYIIFITILSTIFIASIAVAGFFWYRGTSRRAKDIERSLKMVPLLVKLPPQEVEEGSRDIRDVIKENIAKAEGVFNLLSGVATEKSTFYGKKHISFEIVAKGKLINFYIIVPASILSSVQKALVSGYPDIQIEKCEDTNIFSATSKIAGVQGGELKLAHESYLPINTYRESDSDAMVGMLSGLSNLGDNEGAAIQILVRPTLSDWSKKAISRAKQVLDPEKKDNSGYGKAMDLIAYILKAPFRTSSENEQKSKPDKQPDAVDQKKAELIEKKAQSPAFESLIRIIASSDSTARSKVIVQDISLGFAQLSQGGANSFKYKATDEPQKLATNFIFRFFPASRKNIVLNSVELATIFHLPSQIIGISANLERKAAKEVAAPAGLPTEGTRLGLNIFQGNETPIFLTQDDKRRHVYIIGQTGTGKSVLLTNMMLQDAQAGKGFCFIDPNGDEAERLLGRIPPERAEDVIYFSPGDTEFPVGLNIMEYDQNKPEQKDFIVQEMISMLYKLYDPTHQGFIGPQFENWFRNAALTVMSDPNGGTYIEVPRVFTDDEFLKKKFKYLTDPTVQAFWTNEMAQTDARTKSDMLGYFASKFGAVANNEMLRNIIGQRKSALNFRDVMDNNKILIVNLSKGLMGELNAKLLGMIFVIKLQVAAMSRADIPENERVDFGLYVDEFQNIATDSFATILSEARKYHFNLTVANQYIEQIDEQIRDAVFGNVGSMVVHRVGNDDAEYLTKQFAPQFDASDLANIPNHYAVAKIIANGRPVTPFSMMGYPPIDNEVINTELQSAMRDLSRSKYSRPKEEVAAEVAESLDSGVKTPAANTVDSGVNINPG
ncbi:MAG: hypothetical protein QG675_124 [Patescibacteria group bacterium]|jgi:hypothetical protein|nr:hypothetical protein [Patescibacteria group bacterium]